MPSIGIEKRAPGSSLATAAKKAATTGKVVKTSKPKAKAKTGMDGTLAPKELQSQAGYENAFKPGGALWEPAPAVTGPVDPFVLESDPVYQAALSQGRSTFTLAQAEALAGKQNTETALAGERKALDTASTESRRRLAGNYAARGMAGGAAGALSMAEARANAQQVAARTSIADQITALNNQYLRNYGDVTAPGYDWTGTSAGMQYKTQAAQAAIQSRLAQYGAL